MTSTQADGFRHLWRMDVERSSRWQAGEGPVEIHVLSTPDPSVIVNVFEATGLTVDEAFDLARELRRAAEFARTVEPEPDH